MFEIIPLISNVFFFFKCNMFFVGLVFRLKMLNKISPIQVFLKALIMKGILNK